MTFVLHAQQFEASGGVDAQSVRNFLGKTTLSRSSLLLRESLQNSWDARLGERITFLAHERVLGKDQTSALRDEVFHELPPAGRSAAFDEATVGGRMRVLVIGDEGTRGLEGPVRANTPAPNERRNFVDFVRNIGRSRSKGLEGGTYGLGKAVYFDASELGLCVIYSQVHVGGRLQPRLIAMSGGDADYIHNGVLYTGRNWWGVAPLDGEGCVDPLVGDEARQLAERIGFPLPAGKMWTGTQIMILAPVDESGEDRAHLLLGIRDAVEEFAWAKQFPVEAPAVTFDLRLEGRPVTPRPAMEDPRRRHLALAYRHAQARSRGAPLPERFQVKEYDIKSGRTHIGVLALAITPPLEDLHNTSRVALMRKLRQVVRYLPITGLPDGSSIHGVFIVDEEMEDLFAASEPATHDDWIASQVQEGKGKHNMVRIALNHIKETVRQISMEVAPPKPGTVSPGATRLATGLGALVEGFTGSGAGQQPGRGGVRTGGGGARRNLPDIYYPMPLRLSLREGRTLTELPVHVKGGRSESVYSLTAHARIEADDGSPEKEPPADAEMPTFQGWRTPTGFTASPELVLTGKQDVHVTAVFTQPDDTALRLAAEIREERDEVIN